jgi:ribosomal protein S18
MSSSSSTTAAIKRRSDFWRPDLKKVDIEEFDARAISLLPPPREVAVNLMRREAAAAAAGSGSGQETSGSASQQQQQQQQRRGGRGGGIVDTDMRIHPEKKFIPRDTYVPADLNPYQRVFMTIDDEKDESVRRSPATKWREHAALVLKNARRIDFRQYEDLDKFLTASGQLPRREWTGLRTKVQKHVCRQVKIARQMALLPTTQTLAGKRESDQWERYLDEQEMIQNSKRGGTGGRRGGGGGDGGYAQLSAAEQAEQHELLLEQAGRKGGKRGRASGAGSVKSWDAQFSELTEFLRVHSRLPSEEASTGDEKEKELARFLKTQQSNDSGDTVDPSRKAMIDILLLSLHGGDDDLKDEVLVDDKPKKK